MEVSGLARARRRRTFNVLNYGYYIRMISIFLNDLECSLNNVRYKQITETRSKKHFKNEQRSMNAAVKKRANTSGVGKINSLHPRVRKLNFPCNDDNVAFMQQVHSCICG